jgi:hypothetical protein
MALVLSAGCGAGDKVTEKYRADARAYVAAGRDFNRHTPALIQAAEERTARTYYECSLDRVSGTRLPPLSALAGISFIAYYQALLPVYRRYALRLRSVRAQDATLSDVAQAALALSRGYAPVRTARPDYCHTLRAWQAAGWRKDFSVLRAIGVSDTAFDPRGRPRAARIQQAERTIAAAGDRLRELGVAESGVASFLLATDVFAAARGGYTEIVSLGRD